MTTAVFVLSQDKIKSYLRQSYVCQYHVGTFVSTCVLCCDMQKEIVRWCEDEFRSLVFLQHHCEMNMREYFCTSLGQLT